MYYCEGRDGLGNIDALDPLTGAFDVVGAIANIFGQKQASDAQKDALNKQLKIQRELLSAQMTMANQQVQAEAGNTTLYIVGGILAVAVLGVVMASRGSK